MERTIGMHMIPDLVADTPLMAWNQIGTKYTMTKNEDPREKANSAANATLLCRTIRRGTVAYSPFHTWIPIKTMMRTPNRTKRAMIRPLDQAYFVPPHWRASRRQTIAGMNTAVPIGSN